jgi:hypothetical protein
MYVCLMCMFYVFLRNAQLGSPHDMCRPRAYHAPRAFLSLVDNVNQDGYQTMVYLLLY